MNYDSRRIADDLNLLERRLSERSRMLSATPSIAPAHGILTDGFGGRSRSLHRERRAARGGRHLLRLRPAGPRPADGVVVKAEWANGYGNVIFISHGYGFSTRYGHLSKFSVKPGDKVKRGQVIGYVGSTGRSTGPHLHYEVRLNNKPVNPLEYILNAFCPATTGSENEKGGRKASFLCVWGLATGRLGRPGSSRPHRYPTPP